MDKPIHSKHQYPPTTFLSAAIKSLPWAKRGVPPQTVEIDAGRSGRYSVRFVVKPNVRQGKPAWFWGIESSVRITARFGRRRTVEPPSTFPPQLRADLESTPK